jgi:hypothetical protein
VQKLHNYELHSLHSSPNIIWVIKSRRMWWAEHLVRMGEVLIGFLLGGPNGIDQWIDLVGSQLARDRVQWRAFVNTIMILRIL